jgi:hypothetical protein
MRGVGDGLKACPEGDAQLVNAEDGDEQVHEVLVNDNASLEATLTHPLFMEMRRTLTFRSSQLVAAHSRLFENRNGLSALVSIAMT